MNFKKYLISGAAAAIMTLSNVLPAFAATSVIHSGDMKEWTFVQEAPIVSTSTGAMVSGPGTPPLGVGSANLNVGDTGGMILAKPGYKDLKLSDITTLKYSTYRTTGASALAIALQFNFDSDLTDDNETWQGRLVYEPYHTQTVTTGEWQTWDTLNDTAGTGTGNWWFTNSGHATTSTCTQADPCTWTQVKAAFPNGGFHPTMGAVLLKAGGGWTGGFNGNVDALTVNSDVYNFEPSVGPPKTFAQCRNNGWKTFNSPSFKNEGFCIKNVAKSERTVKGNITYTTSAGGFVRTARFGMNSAALQGSFAYKDANRDWYTVNKITDVNVSGKSVWFAGQVTSASNPSWVGQWLFAKVTDGSPDTISGSFTDMATAKEGVKNMTNPSDGPFNVTSGDLYIR